MEFKGTKGKWVFSHISEESNGYISLDIPMGCITIYNGFYPHSFSAEKENCVEILEANAQVISCTLEMLEMLDLLTTVYSAENIEKAKLLIKKSTTI